MTKRQQRWYLVAFAGAIVSGIRAGDVAGSSWGWTTFVVLVTLMAAIQAGRTPQDGEQ